MNRRDPTIGKFTQYRSVSKDSTTLGGSFVWALFEDRRNNLWIGAWNAPLSRFDLKTEKFIRYGNLPGNSVTMALQNVLCFAEDKAGKIWLGTIEGLVSFDYATNIFTTYDERHGIASKMLCGIAIDRHDAVWVSTLRGVSRFDQKTETFRNYTESDGLQGIEFEQYAYTKDSQGRIYFGGFGGINIFDPDSMKENPFVSPVQITRMQVMEQPFSLANIPADGVVLNYDQNFISFEYAALSFSAPEKNQYAYMLEGIDAHWVQAGTRRYASYTGLPPGKYIFRVRGSNNDGVWNLEGARLSITIVPPFWMMWWFRLIIIVGFLSIGPIIYFRRVTQLQKETKRQEEFSRQLINSQEDERKRIASELHDSLGQNLLFIKNSAVLGTNKNDLKRYSDISETALSSIEEVRRIAFNLFPYQLDRLGLTKAIESVVRAVGESSAIQFQTSIQKIDGIFSKEQESSIFRIVQECLNNIIKHSGATVAAVHIRKSEGELVITIGDNGRGFDVEGMKNESKGFGLKNIYNRVMLFQGNIIYTSSKEFKTLVTVSLPVPHGQKN